MQSNTSVSAIACCLLATLGAPFHALVCSNTATAAQIDLAGPPGSGAFGRQVHLLPNGNFVVTDPGFDAPGGIVDVGAVHLYRPDGGLIYTLRGSSASDQVGLAGVTVLSSGNFVVNSYLWDNGSVFDAGAATWCNGVSGSDAVVSVSNSLIGNTASNRVGSSGIFALTNGHYVVASYEWDSSTVIDAGAVTWGNGVSGSAGGVSASNSLVGSSAGDQVSAYGVTALSNGNYVTRSPLWNDGTTIDAGAATWGNGVSGSTGVISVSNSLVGSTASDRVGEDVVALSNGHYVALAYSWDNSSIVDAGAATWGNGVSGSSGVVSINNSLVGSTAADSVGDGSAVALSNGHYVVRSSVWDNAGVVDAGAVTWRNGSSASAAVVSVANSLVGTTAGDMNSPIVTPLSNGHYVVSSRDWDNGSIVDAGAATWRNGTSGSGGVISASNSLVGSNADDRVGYPVTVLRNGHYVVSSYLWDNGAFEDVGAATWRDGTGGGGAVVSASNSLIGSAAFDRVGLRGAEALSNGHYVVSSPYWANALIANAGAATWRNGTSGSGAVVSASNSLIGSSPGDLVGESVVVALSNGHYVVGSGYWASGVIDNAGAATWRNGSGSSSGLISAGNSLVGTTAVDRVGDSSYGDHNIVAQSNGNYVVWSRYWNNGAIVDAGAISLGFGSGGTIGPITAANSVRGTVANGGLYMNYAYDALRAQLIVGRPDSNVVSLLRPGAVTSASIILDTPDPSGPGEVVTFVTTIVASPAPSAGSVRVAANTGETCTDASPTATGANTAEFSCQIQFVTLGARSVRAEFLGTNSHGYSASGVEPHNVAVMFADGFE